VKQFNLLSAQLFCENVGTPEQIADLKSQALANRADPASEMAFTNENCWRSNFKYNNIDWLLYEIGKLVDSAIIYYEKQDPVYSNKVKHYGQPEIEYWTNVNEPFSKNSLHSHSLHHYVACYYIQAEDTGDIVFHNPANLLEQCHPHSPFVSRMAFSPKLGDLLVWPAWVPHETEMNLSNQQMFNIEFNIRFKTPRMINEKD
jgi:hypothetical protein